MTAPISSTPAVPTEDRYAALKDLDSLMKSQIAANNTVPSTPAQEPLQPVANNTDPWGKFQYLEKSFIKVKHYSYTSGAI